MKKTIITILFALISGSSFSQTLSKADFMEDLEFLKKTLPVKHTNLFAKINRSQFENKVDQVSMRSNGFDRNRFIVELFKLTKCIGDEHTFIEVDFTKVLPIQFELFKEGLFVVGIDSANASVLNSKLESINGHPVNEVLARFKEIIQYENPSYFDDRLLQHLNNPVLLNGLALIDSDSTATFTLSNGNGQTQKISLKPVAGKDVTKLNLARSGKNLLSHKKGAIIGSTIMRIEKSFISTIANAGSTSNIPLQSSAKSFSLSLTNKNLKKSYSTYATTVEEIRPF